MENNQDDSSEGIPWQTMYPNSWMFFVAILLWPFVPAVLIQVYFHPDILWSGDYLKWVWFVLLGGFGSMFEFIRQTNTWYFTTYEGIERRGLFLRKELRWSDLEAVGKQKIFAKKRFSYGEVEAIVVHLYGRQRTFSLRMSVLNAESLIYVAVKRCPEILRIDETDGMFELPCEGDGERLRSIVARHARRLRRKHTIILMACGLILLPGAYYVGMHIRAGSFSWNDVKTIIYSLSIYLVPAWRHWTALWRLRK